MDPIPENQSLVQKKIALAQSEYAPVIIELMRDIAQKVPLIGKDEWETVKNAVVMDTTSTLMTDMVDYLERIRQGALLGKKSLEANVILNTALNRVSAYNKKGQNKTLSEILSTPNQYQAYQSPQYKAYFNPPDPVALKKKQEIDSILNEIFAQVKAGKYNDSTGGAYYYAHNKDGTIEYDNKKPLFAS